MIISNNTKISVEVVLGDSPGTELQCTATYIDTPSSSGAEGQTSIDTNGTTPVTIVPALTQTNRRQVTSIYIFNPDGDAHDVTVQINNNSSVYVLFTWTVPAGGSIIYAGNVWQLLTAAGVPPAEGSGTFVPYTGASSDVDLGLNGLIANDVNISGQTALRIAIFDAGKNVISADTATYPSLTELTYVKGVTSAIQTQINSKIGAATTDTLTNKTFDGTGTGNSVSNMLTESAEANSTPVADNSENAASLANTRCYAYLTLPSTHKFYLITGIEWKNGTAVAGNVTAGVDIVDADPPTLASTPMLALSQQVAQSGTNAVQRVSRISSRPIPAGTIIGIWFYTDGAGKFRRLDSQASANYRKVITYTVAAPSQDATAWTATTNREYVKVYYKGYS